jgi:hypothetical protein
MSRLIHLLLLSIGISPIFAQNCNWIETPPSCICEAETACGLSKLDNICFDMLPPMQQAVSFPFCNFAQINNPAFFAFRTGVDLFTLRITPSRCVGIGENNGRGVQAALIARNNALPPFECEDPCFTTLFNDFIPIALWCEPTEGPILLEEISGNPFLTYYLIIDGNGGDVCEVNIEVLEGITPENLCWTDSLELTPFNCHADTVDFNIDISGGDISCADSVSFVINGDTLGLYSPFDFPVFLENVAFSTDGYQVLAFTGFDSSCIAETFVPAFNCNDCGIENLFISTGKCTDQDKYEIEISINLKPFHSDTVIVYNENNIYGEYPTSEFPLIITDFPWNRKPVQQISICEKDQPQACCKTLFIPTPECLDISSCFINYLIAEPYPCEGDSFMVDIDFMHGNGIGQSDSFYLFLNGIVYGQYAYSDLYLTVGPFRGDGETYLFRVEDSNNEFCDGSFELEGIECMEGDCEINEIEVSIGGCNSENTYMVEIDFNHVNETGEFFDLFINGSFFDFFNYSDLPIVIDEFPTSGKNFDGIEVCDNDNDGCCGFIEWPIPECLDTSNDCSIRDIIYNVFDCENGEFFIGIDFIFENTGDEGFTIQGNGMNYGEFNYENTPVILGPLPADETQWEFVVIDLQNQNCSADIGIGQIQCEEEDECSIRDISHEIIDCYNDSFFIQLNFIFENAGDEGFTIQGNGKNYGAYHYNDVPIILGPLPVDDTQWEFVIIDLQNEDCMDAVEVGMVECPGCGFIEINAEVGKCSSDSTYELFLDFVFEGVTNDFFDLSANGEFFGFYSYTDLPLNIDDFPASGNEIDRIEICDNDNPDCCAEHEFISPKCGFTSSEDRIKDLRIDYFPNPASDIIHIQLNGSGYTSNATIYNLNGLKILERTNIRPGLNSIDVSNLQAGVYFIRVETEGQTSTGRISIVR